MKIMFFTTGMTRGGAERVIATLSNHFVALGHSVDIIMVKGNSSEYLLDHRVGLCSAHLSPGFINGVTALRFLMVQIGNKKPDVIFSFCYKANILVCLSKIFGIQVPIIVSERADPFSRNRMKQSISNYVYKFADGIVCQSERVAGYYEMHSGVPLVKVIANPLDENCVASKPNKQRGNYILSVGRLCRQKRQDLIIDAFSRISRSFPETHLKICGEGPSFSELVKLAEKTACQERIVFEGNVDNVLRKFGDAKIFVMTSDFEGFPNALIEAAASGIPSIATDFSPGTAREIIVDYYNGLVVPRGDVEAISNALEILLTKQIPYESLLKSSEEIKHKYSVAHIASEWVNFSQEVGACFNEKDIRRQGDI